MIIKSPELAVNGGPKVRMQPWPARASVGVEEKEAVNLLFDDAIASGNAPGYGGDMEDEYCREFSKWMGIGYADAVNSGTNAVFVALRALGCEPFTEIIGGPITDAGGMMPIVMMNCIPVISDTVPGKFVTGPEQIEAMITPYTSAIIVTHIAGEPADMEGIMSVARKHNLPVLEDCAQAHGAEICGKKVGSFGDIAAFSTMFSKLYCSGGQGGLVFTKQKELYQKVRWASDRGKPYGLPEGSTNCIASLNFNLDEIHSALGLAQLKKLDNILKRRREVVSELADGIMYLKSISIPAVQPDMSPSYWFLRLKFNSDKMICTKSMFCEALEAEGLPVGMNYNHMPHKHDWFRNKCVFGDSGFPWTSSYYKGNYGCDFECPNAEDAIENHFILFINESWDKQAILDAIKTFEKVEQAFIR